MNSEKKNQPISDEKFIPYFSVYLPFFYFHYFFFFRLDLNVNWLAQLKHWKENWDASFFSAFNLKNVTQPYTTRRHFFIVFYNSSQDTGNWHIQYKRSTLFHNKNKIYSNQFIPFNSYLRILMKSIFRSKHFHFLTKKKNEKKSRLVSYHSTVGITARTGKPKTFAFWRKNRSLNRNTHFELVTRNPIPSSNERSLFSVKIRIRVFSL